MGGDEWLKHCVRHRAGDTGATYLSQGVRPGGLLRDGHRVKRCMAWGRGYCRQAIGIRARRTAVGALGRGGAVRDTGQGVSPRAIGGQWQKGLLWEGQEFEQWVVWGTAGYYCHKLCTRIQARGAAVGEEGVIAMVGRRQGVLPHDTGSQA